MDATRVIGLALALAFGSLPAAAQRENLVLCMGHSNMAGANSYFHLWPFRSVFRSTTRAWNPTVRALEPYVGFNAQGWGNSTVGNFGPDFGIAAALEQKYGSFVIVKLAAPGAPLMAVNNQHKPAYERAANQLWPLIVGEIQAVEAAVRAEGRQPYWAEMVWIQWETDAKNPAGYGATFRQFIADLRGITSPALPVTVERPIRHPAARWPEEGWQSIAAQLGAECAADPLMRLVDAEFPGMQFRNDLTHRTWDSSCYEGWLLGMGMIGLTGETR